MNKALEGKIISFKLNSGEELIAKVVKIELAEVTISYPVSIAPGPQGVGLMPSFFTSDPKSQHRLNISSISMYAETDPSVQSKYTEATTGLVVPEKKLILG